MCKITEWGKNEKEVFTCIDALLKDVLSKIIFKL